MTNNNDSGASLLQPVTSPIVGIDLGTTNSLIGIYDSGFPLLLADEEGSRLTPSVVTYPQKEPPVVGRPAQRQRLIAPERTITSIKRLMGSGNSIKIDDQTLSPEKISSDILKQLKKIAEERLDEKIHRAVITVPAYFNDTQRSATKKAGELAGFTVERILSEPTAAALAYGLDKLHDQATVAVYDFGGGTFDLSIMKLDQGVFQVLSTQGDTKLGGDDIDETIATYFLSKSGIKKLTTPVAYASLCEAARKAKEELSFTQETIIRLPFLEKDLSLEFSFTREELEKIILPLIQRTRIHCLRALSDAGIDPLKLDEVILVGGSTRIPAVRNFVEDLFGKAPNLSQHPDEAVALGAVLQGAILDGRLSNVSLLDITPLSLGIETFGGLMNVIIPRNTTIPTKAGEMFTNAVSGQTAMKITILQGERELAADNWKLGELEIPFSSAPKGIARVGVQFAIDANGILEVLVRDTTTGKEKVVKISHAIEISDDAVEAMLSESLEHAFDDMDARIFTEAKLKAEEMLPAVDQALAQLKDEVSEDEKQAILLYSSKVRSALDTQATKQLKESLEELDQITQSLAAKLIEKVLKK